MLKMILADASEIELVEAGATKHYVLLCADQAAFDAVWAKMTDGNLASIRVEEDGVTVQQIANARLSGTQTLNNEDGTITGHIYLTGGDFVPDEYSEAGRILLGEEE